MSKVVDPRNTDGYHLTYLPKYMLSTDVEMQESDEYFKSRFLTGLKRMLPEFDQQQIVSVHVNRATKVQPLLVLDYSALVPDATTHHPDLFVLNTSQRVDATLNNNEVIGAVNRFFDAHAGDLTA